MNLPVVQSSALDIFVKSGPVVVVAIVAFWFMEVQNQRKDELVLKLLEQQTLRIQRLESFVRQCLISLERAGGQTGSKILPQDFGEPSK